MYQSNVIGLALLVTAAGIILAFVLLVAWLLVSPGARRWRRFRRGQRLLQTNAWREAREIFEGLQQSGRLSAAWQARLRQALSVCHGAAGREHLRQKEYENALAALVQSAELAGEDVSAAQAQVLDAMLADLRAQFALSRGADDAKVHDLARRVFALQPVCPEAAFWQALAFIRQGKREQAIATLQGIVAAGDLPQPSSERKLDPYLYLGALLLERGDAREALRLLSEANRIDSGSPLVVSQLARAVLASGGDAQIAVRALQRALGPRGFQLWERSPQRIWVEGFPEEKSFVRKLAAEHPYICPLWGPDYHLPQRQASAALADGLYRLGHYEQAVEIYENVSRKSVPSVEVLRGLGLALVRLERYDQAFKHLRAAYELENPKKHTTAGYLALCAAKGKPASPEDKVNNIQWALWLVRGYSAHGDLEYIDLLSRIFAEARSSGVAIELADQLHLCDHLHSVTATNPPAADAYHHLAATHPEAVRDRDAWLYCRAAQMHNLHHEHGADLFARLFQKADEARAYFDGQGWSFDDVEFSFLERHAARQTGSFPEVLGPDYPARGEPMLLERARRLAAEGKLPEAVTTAQVLVRLSPAADDARDLLAQLQYRNSQTDAALATLEEWRERNPSAWLPLVRLSVLYHERGNAARSDECIRQALDRTGGREHADVAFLGARLRLAEAVRSGCMTGDSLRQAADLLRRALHERPDHRAAAWCLAAASFVGGDSAAATVFAQRSPAEGAANPKHALVAAVGHLAAGRPEQVAAACASVAEGDPSRAECEYLLGWAAADRGDAAAAAGHFAATAASTAAPSRQHALAFLGGICFFRRDYSGAVRCWKDLDPERRAEWGFDASLAKTVYLAALQQLRGGRFAEAAEHFREAGKLGLREPRLASLLSLSLFKAAQQRLYEPEAANLLEQAARVGKPTAEVFYLLAMCHKRLGKRAEARDALRKITPPDANVLLQLGVLSFAEANYAQAEEEFARALQLDANFYPALYNLLLCRICLGQLDRAAELLPRLQERARGEDERRFVTILSALVRDSASGAVAAAELRSNGQPIGSATTEDMLALLSDDEEQTLLHLLQGIPRVEAVVPLVYQLVRARPHSPRVQRASVELILLHAKRFADRCQWAEADQLLAPLSRQVEVASHGGAVPADVCVAYWNLQGCCACMLQDFDRAVRCFSTALRWAANDPWLYQNLALACEIQGRLDQAEAHWNRYFDLLDQRVPTPARPNYLEDLAYAGLSRLADQFTRLERWGSALSYVQRAHRLRPRDLETLERLFSLYVQVRRPEDARRTLRKMRELKPNDPQMDLYELDLREVRGLDDLDRMLADIKRILSRHPGDPRVEDRASGMVLNCIPIIGRRCDQLAEQLGHIVEQVRRLPNYQINWPVVHDEMHYLRHEFQKLRRISNKCLSLVTSEEQRRVIRDLNAHIDSKIEICISMGG